MHRINYPQQSTIPWKGVKALFNIKTGYEWALFLRQCRCYETNKTVYTGVKKNEVESVIRVRLYEKRGRTNFVYYIAFFYPTKSYSRHKFIACKSFYSKMLNLFPNYIHLNFPVPDICIFIYSCCLKYFAFVHIEVREMLSVFGGTRFNCQLRYRIT